MGFFQTFWTWLNGQLASYIGANTARVAAALEHMAPSVREANEAAADVQVFEQEPLNVISLHSQKFIAGVEVAPPAPICYMGRPCRL